MLESILIFLILVLDQVTKYLTERFLPLGASHPVWPGVFEFANVHNTGAAWGILAGGRWFFIVVTMITCAAMGWLLIKKRGELGKAARICLALLIAGAAGNLIDRVLLGYVRDMFYVSLINFPVFNVADSAVSIGAVLLVLDVLFTKQGSLFAVLEQETSRKQAAQPAEETAAESAATAAEETPEQAQSIAETELSDGD